MLKYINKKYNMRNPLPTKKVQTSQRPSQQVTRAVRACSLECNNEIKTHFYLIFRKRPPPEFQKVQTEKTRKFKKKSVRTRHHRTFLHRKEKEYNNKNRGTVRETPRNVTSVLYAFVAALTYPIYTSDASISRAAMLTLFTYLLPRIFERYYHYL